MTMESAQSTHKSVPMCTFSLYEERLAQTLKFNKILEIDSDIIAVDYETHTKLVNSNKKHELLDNYLEENERIDLYNFVLSKYDWYKNLSDNSKFEFNKINILSLMSPLEFHEYVLGVLIKLQSIKRSPCW